MLNRSSLLYQLLVMQDFSFDNLYFPFDFRANSDVSRVPNLTFIVRRWRLLRLLDMFRMWQRGVSLRRQGFVEARVAVCWDEIRFYHDKLPRSAQTLGGERTYFSSPPQTKVYRSWYPALTMPFAMDCQVI